MNLEVDPASSCKEGFWRCVPRKFKTKTGEIRQWELEIERNLIMELYRKGLTKLPLNLHKDFIEPSSSFEDRSLATSIGVLTVLLLIKLYLPMSAIQLCYNC